MMRTAPLTHEATSIVRRHGSAGLPELVNIPKIVTIVAILQCPSNADLSFQAMMQIYVIN
jgi:hypothetical protein